MSQLSFALRGKTIVIQPRSGGMGEPGTVVCMRTRFWTTRWNKSRKIPVPEGRPSSHLHTSSREAA